MSSEEGFFDILYLGIFVNLSPAFDPRFYLDEKPSPSVINEVVHAARQFQSILQVFSLRFFIILDGEAVSHVYVVERMLAEFAAAAVVFAKGIQESTGNKEGDGSIFSMFPQQIEAIVQGSHPDAFPYYSRCLNRRHKHFMWTGPKVQILRRSEEIVSAIPLLTRGEHLDLPSHSIYSIDLDAEDPTAADQVGKRHGRGDSSDFAEEHPKKRQRQA